MNFQTMVGNWITEAFGEESSTNIIERNNRFLEEALELVQASGYSKEKVLDMVEYVYNRPPGELHQEVGGVALTLVGLCNALKVNYEKAAITELHRVWEKIEVIRKKNKGKPSTVVEIYGKD